jgi:hypothetical protein
METFVLSLPISVTIYKLFGIKGTLTLIVSCGIFSLLVMWPSRPPMGHAFRLMQWR